MVATRTPAEKSTKRQIVDALFAKAVDDVLRAQNRLVARYLP